MNSSDPFKFSTRVIVYPLSFVLLIWLVYWFELRFGFRFNDMGIYPRTFSGLRGILFSPFIHGSLEHLYHNSTPLLILSTALFYFYRALAWRVLVLGLLFSGFLTWLIGSPAFHIGASGLIYVLMSFMLFKGILSKNHHLTALSLLVVFLYGSMLWYVFPVKENMSWEGHLSGLLVGLVFAFVFRTAIAKPVRYIWEDDQYNEQDDPFLKQFDAEGNFIESPKEEMHTTDSTVDVQYSFKNKDV
jgi:membrane associated rhomboid family serine protease|tara:strand:+ start:145 stop:876 length:732 start_codon:yes stop_codon:yes gene_type:complete